LQYQNSITIVRRVQAGAGDPALAGRASEVEASRLNPKSEIKMAGLHPSVGHKRFGKISPDRCGYGCDFSKPFLRQ
jgi:hypothetical protein